MAGMYDPFNTKPLDWLASAVIYDFNAEIITIDGLMGIYHPGFEYCLKDYNEGLCW